MKQIPDEVIESTWAKLKAWHIAARTAQLKDAFELGDLLLLAVINTGLDKEQVALRLREQLGDIAYCMGTYRRAARMAEIFTSSQRKVLIDKCVPITRVQTLASDDWTKIAASRDFKPPKTQSGALRHGLNHPDDVIGIQVRMHGEFQRSFMFEGLRSLFSQIDEDAIIEMANKAIADLRKRGKDIKPLRI